MRPTYETKADKDREAGVADALAEAWRCKVLKMPAFYQVDWACHMGGALRAWVEIKCRNNPSHQYPTLILSLHKWLHGKQLARETGIPFVLVVKWSDGIFFCKIEEQMKPYITFGGRMDRGDPQDREPVVEININLFKKVCE